MRRILPASLLLIALLAGCGSGSNSAASTSSTAAGTTATAAGSATTTAGSAAGTATKPTVKIPATLPTKLVITDLKVGTGVAAKNGDTVVVNYVGVRSADGTEFDNSYDRGQTFSVNLGQQGVIAGWDQGLVGIQVGGERQLDIPADLAYGNNPPPGNIVKAGDALTFVIDCVSILPGVDVPKANAADKPTVDVKPSVGATATTFTDLVVGTGQTAEANDKAYLQIIAYNGVDGKELQSTWEQGQAAEITLNNETIAGLVTGVTGMKVGGRREVIVPPSDAFGPEGSTAMGLPAGADLILVVDLVQVAKAS